MSSLPLISIYITNYNYSRFIRQSIESVLAQSFQNFELFIIDDGSTDDSRKIIEEYSSYPQVNIIYQKNKGLNITNNIALRVASGKYIVRLDADDYLDANALQLMNSIMEQDDELGLIFPDYYLVDSNNNLIGEVKRHNFKDEVSLLDLPAHGACTMIRRDFLLKLGGYDESYSCQDGYELWIKFIANYKVLNINKPLFYYRQHGNNLTSNEKRILDTRIKIKDNFITNNNIILPRTVAVIPVRTTMLSGRNLPLIEINNQTLLERLCRIAVNARNISRVVVTSADMEIKELFSSRLVDISDKLCYIERPAEFERINEPLITTLKHILNNEQVAPLQAEAVMTVALEYPFLTSDIIDDAVNTLTIFGADSLLSVRPDNSMYYQHDGSGLHPILGQDKFTKLEREAIYKGVGGIVLSRIKGFMESNKMLHGKIGHIVVDSSKAMGILGDFDLAVVKHLLEDKYLQVKI